jgi:hypothetical protein
MVRIIASGLSKPTPGVMQKNLATVQREILARSKMPAHGILDR